MTSETIERAHALRTDHPDVPAVARMRWVRSADRVPAFVDALAAGETLERDGFTLRLSIEPDYDPDISWLGTFTDRHEPGAVANPDGRFDSRVLPWFVPAITEDEHYRGLRALKFGKARARELARSYVLHDLETARDYAPVIAFVTATRAGVELGRAALGGIDDENYARSWDIVGDLVEEALEEARTTLGQLCAA